MKSLFIKEFKHFLAILYCIFLTGFITSAQSLQIYGDASNNSFNRVIPSGQNFYVLGSDNGIATVSRMDNAGNCSWTTRLGIGSVWTDGIVVQGSGNLLVVGYTLPFNSTNKSLIGEITPAGVFICVNQLEGPGNEGLERIDRSSSGDYLAVGFHTAAASQRDVVIYSFSSSCTVNYKKQFFSSTIDNFDKDIEVLQGGDFIVGGAAGNNGIIYRTNTGGFVGGVQGPLQFSYTDLEETGNGDILAVANSTAGGDPRIFRFDSNLFPIWEAEAFGMSTFEQIIDAGNNDIYVVGTDNIAGVNRAVILNINDGGGTPSFVWAKYISNNETAYTGGAMALWGNGDIAFVDGRDGHPNSFGLSDAFLALTDSGLNSDCTFSTTYERILPNTLFDGPLEVLLFDSEMPQVMPMEYTSLDCQQTSACGESCDCSTDGPVSGLELTHDGINYPLFCLPHGVQTPVIPCPIGNMTVSGFYGCIDSLGELCEETPVSWNLKDLGGNLIDSGVTTPFTQFFFTAAQVGAPGTYFLTLSTLCPGMQDSCVCIVDWIVEDCDNCCDDLEAFCETIENAISITIDEDLCKATFNIDSLPDCDYIEWIDWGDGSFDPGPHPPGSMPMHVFSGSATYIISWLATERDTAGFVCFEKVFSDTITIVCDNCCDDFESFCETIENAISITIDEELCKATFNISNLPDCDYIEWVNWGDGNQDNGPHSPGSMPMHVYSGGGTYVISWLAIEVDSGGFICFEKILTQTITLDCFCPGNYIQNGDFTLGTPLGIESIWNANDWGGIWQQGLGTNHNGDFWEPPVPQPHPCFRSPNNPDGNYAGFWSWRNFFSKAFRQGIMNQLSSPINDNSGCYEITLKVACTCGPWIGQPRLAVYGVYVGETTRVVPPAFPNGPLGSFPNNEDLFGPLIGGFGAEELGVILLPKSCNDNFMTYTLQFDSGNLTNPIDRIFFTRDDFGPLGISYLNLDDICIQPTSCELSCTCGDLEWAQIVQTGSSFSKPIACNNSPSSVQLPCSKPGQQYVIHGNFHCDVTSCGDNIVNWTLNGPGGPYTGTSSLAYPYFSIAMPSSYFPQNGGTYTLNIDRQCGSNTCNCQFTFTVPDCPCLCDDDFYDSADQGFEVTSPSPLTSCTRYLKPTDLCADDEVVWNILGIGTVGTSMGNNSIPISFPGPGKYQVCMIVTRMDPTGTICSFEKCQSVYVKCMEDPDQNPNITFCQTNMVKNGDFSDSSFVTGFLYQNAFTPEWDVFPNEGESFIYVDSTGASDEGHVILMGGMNNFAGIFQPMELMPNEFVTVEYQLRNYNGGDLPEGTRIEVRLQPDPLPISPYQVLSTYTIDSTSGWVPHSHSMPFMQDTSMHYLVICVQSDDPTRLSFIGLDNIEICTSLNVDLEPEHTRLSNISLFPNPTAGTLTMEFDGIRPKAGKIQILDLLGRLVHVEDIQTGIQNHEWSIEGVPSGVYIVRLLEAGIPIWAGKVVKQ